MKYLYVLVAVALLMGCQGAVKPTPVPIVEPIPVVIDVSSDDDKKADVYQCVHKYDKSRRFKYEVPIIGYQTTLFGKRVIMHEYTQPNNGGIVILSSNEVANYVCKLVR